MELGLGLAVPRRGLPSRISKVAAGAKIAVLGDSEFARASSFTTSAARTTAENRANSEIMWAHFRDPRFLYANWWDNTATAANRIPSYGDSMAADNLYSGANFGYSGDTASGCLKRVQAVINSGADICIVNAGTNVGTTDALESTTIISLQSIVEQLVAGDVKVIIGTVRPRRVAVSPTGSEISPASMQRILSINAAIRANYRSWGASALWDPWEDLRDPQYSGSDNLYGSILPIYAIADGVHITPRGAHAASVTLQAAIAKVVEAGKWFNPDPTVSNILSNGIFTGSGGTVGGGFTGSLPAGWSIQNTTGAGQPVTGVASTEDNSDTSGKSIVLTLSSSGAGSANTFGTVRLGITSAPTTGFQSTDWVRFLLEVEVSHSAILASLQATLGQSSTISARGHGQTTSAYNNEPTPGIDTDLSGWLATEPLLVESRTSLNPRFDIAIRNDVAGSAVIKIKRALLRVVSNPTNDFAWSPT